MPSAPPSQLALLPDVDPDFVQRVQHEMGRYTANDYERTNPHSYQLVLQLVRDGQSVRSICRDFKKFYRTGIHHRTVAAIIEKNFTPAQVREFQAQALRRGASVAVDVAIDALESAHDDMEKIEDPADRVKAKTQIANTGGVIAGIFNTNAEAMQGHATVVIGSPRTEVSADDLKDMVRAAAESARRAKDSVSSALPLQDVQVSESPGVHTVNTEPKESP